MKKILPLLLFCIILACTKATDEPIVPDPPAGQIDIINNTDYAVTINTVDGAKDFKPTRLTAKLRLVRKLRNRIGGIDLKRALQIVNQIIHLILPNIQLNTLSKALCLMQSFCIRMIKMVIII
jgi:hypothetical protein